MTDQQEPKLLPSNHRRRLILDIPLPDEVDTDRALLIANVVLRGALSQLTPGYRIVPEVWTTNRSRAASEESRTDALLRECCRELDALARRKGPVKKREVGMVMSSLLAAIRVRNGVGE